MILMHKSLKRSDDLMRTLRRYFKVNNKSIDGFLYFVLWQEKEIIAYRRLNFDYEYILKYLI